jgi:hypothetical protein
MHHAFRDALAIEVLELLDQMDVLQQHRSAAAGSERVLVVGDGGSRSGGESGTRHSGVSSVKTLR